MFRRSKKCSLTLFSIFFIRPGLTILLKTITHQSSFTLSESFNELKALNAETYKIRHIIFDPEIRASVQPVVASE